MATIRDVAAYLGVSTSTVSRALTDNPGVSEETRRRVKEAAEQLNYSVNRFARNLVAQRSNTIGFMISDISDGFFASCAYGAEEALQNTPYELTYTNVRRDPAKVLEYLARAEEYCYAGAFITIDDWTDAIVRKLQTLQIPVISLRRKTPDALIGRIPYVDSDHQGGMDSIINHLTRLGHQRFGYIGYDTHAGSERAATFLLEAEKRSITVYPVSNFSFHNAQIRISAGYNSTQRLLEEHPDITVICAGDDLIALGALQYLQENHIRVPEDISLVGYDDRDLSRVFSIQLTTVHQQMSEMGQYAGQMMLQMIAHPELPCDNLLVPTTLKLRSTTGPARSREESA